MSVSRTNGLHLPDLSISNFRGINRLSIDRLGRVTLLGGRNGVGKTTVLEAVHVHALRGGPSVLDELLDKREEYAPTLDEDHDQIEAPDYAALFYGRTATQERPIRIGPNSGKEDLRIEVSNSADWSSREREELALVLTGADVQAIKVTYRGKERLLPWLPIARGRGANWLRRRHIQRLRHRLDDGRDWPIIECESLGPGLPSNRRLAHFWDRVALTEEEDLSLQALRLTDDRIQRVAVVGDKEPGYRRLGRRVVVKIRGYPHPIPLKSLGDGVTRLFAAGLALANSRNGFLVVDEAENGVHYSVQRDFWRMVLQSACQHNVQVLATTHSKDCVRGFARAAAEFGEAGGVYVRLERDGEEVWTVEYTNKELQTVAEQDIEVR